MLTKRFLSDQILPDVHRSVLMDDQKSFRQYWMSLTYQMIVPATNKINSKREKNLKTLFYFQSVIKVLNKFWFVLMNRNHSITSIKRGNETIDISCQELYPVVTFCWSRNYFYCLKTSIIKNDNELCLQVLELTWLCVDCIT